MTNYPIIETIRLRVTMTLSSVGFQPKYTFPANAIVCWHVETRGRPRAYLDQGFGAGSQLERTLCDFVIGSAAHDNKVSGSVFAHKGQRLMVGKGSGGGTARIRFDIFLLGEDPDSYTDV